MGDSSNPFKLQTAIHIGFSFPILQGSRIIGLHKKVFHSVFGVRILNDQKIPWLHITDRTRMMGGQQDAAKRVFRNLIGKEIFANVSSFKNSTIDGLPFFSGKVPPFWRNSLFQNSTPFWALMPLRKGCLIIFISETRSAASISSGFAPRPVITT